jgi:hypothetical protein
VAAGLKSTGDDSDADARLGDARSEAEADLNDALGAAPLDNLEQLREVIHARLPLR